MNNETKTWNIENGVSIETPMENLLFLKDVEGVCKRHNMNFFHEDCHGVLLVKTIVKKI